MPATASPIPAATLTKLRKSNQHSRLYVWAFDPAVVLTATVTTLPEGNDSVAQVGWTVASGTLSDVLPDMTCLVGTTAGAYDIGIVRIRKAPTSSELFVNETSEIEWVVGQHLTVLDDFSIWPKHIRVIEEPLTFLMDWDVEYSNEHENTVPVVNMGTHKPVWLEGTSVDVTMYCGDSFTVGSPTIASILWECPDADTISGETTNTVTVSFSSSGTYRISCKITTSDGAIFTGYRYIRIFDDSDMPITEFTLESLSGSFEQGGWEAELVLRGEASRTDVRDRSVIVVFSRDWYGGVEESLGPLQYYENVLFVGWVDGETIDPDPENQTVSFAVKGPHHWLSLVQGFPAGYEDTDFADHGGGSPNNWVEFEDMTPEKVLFGWLTDRTTINRCTDVFLLDVDDQLASAPAPEGDLWSQLINLSDILVLARPCCDRYGALHVLQDQRYLLSTEREAVAVLCDLTTDDFSAYNIERRVVPDVAWAELSGVYFKDGYAEPIGARCPGGVPKVLGRERLIRPELVMSTQEVANEWAGWVAGAGSGEIAYASVTLAQTNKFVDVMPYMWVRVTLSADDNIRGLSGTFRLIPQQITHEYQPETGFLGTEVVFVGEGVRYPAVPMEFPNVEEPPVVPPPEIPPVPPPGLPPPPPPTDLFWVLAATVSDIRTTDDFESTDPEWETEIG